MDDVEFCGRVRVCPDCYAVVDAEHFYDHKWWHDRQDATESEIWNDINRFRDGS